MMSATRSPSAPSSTTPKRGYNTEAFMPSAHPFKTRTSLAAMYGDYNMFVPMNVFKTGSVGWRDIRTTANQAHGSAAYLAMIEFVGEMLKMTRFWGSTDDNNRRRSFRYTFIGEDGKPRSLPKVRLLFSLIVRRTRRETGSALRGNGGGTLPDHELFDPKNQVGILVTLHVLDPNIRLMQVVWSLVTENAGTKSMDRLPYVSEDDDLEKTVAVGNGATAADEEDDETAAGEGEEEEEEDGDGRRRQRSKNKRTTNTSTNGRSNKRRKTGSATSSRIGGNNNTEEDGGGGGGGRRRRGGGGGRDRDRDRDSQSSSGPGDISQLYRSADRINTAVSWLVDVPFGTSRVIDDEKWMSSLMLWNAIKSTEDATALSEIGEGSAVGEDGGGGGTADVNLKKALSLEHALEMARLCAGPEATSDQLLSDMYHAPGNSDADPQVYCVPEPRLTWEYQPEQAASKRLCASAFPWKTYGPAVRIAAEVARTLNLPLGEILKQCDMSLKVRAEMDVERRVQGQLPRDTDDLSDNAEYLSRRYGLRVPGVVDRRAIDTGAGVTMEDEIVEELGTGHAALESSICAVGRGTAVIREFVSLYLATNRTNPRLRDIMRNAIDGRRGHIDGGDRGDGDDNDPVPDHETAVELLEGRCSEAMKGASRVALSVLESLADPTARVPASTKTAAAMLDRMDAVSLDYFVHSRNLGMFGQVTATIMSAIRQKGIAVNQWPTLLMMLARDTGYVAWRCGLAISVMLVGKYAGGKSEVLRVVHAFSVPESTVIVNGASAKGAVPTHHPPDKPYCNLMILYDEALGSMSESKSKMSAGERELESTLSSMLTSMLISYQSNEKVGDRIESVTITIKTNVNLGTGANAPQENKVGKRMIYVYVRDDVSGPRNAINMMLDPAWCNGRSEVRTRAVVRWMKTQHALTLMASEAVIIGALPVPNCDRLFTYFQAACEFLKLNYPDVAENVRAVDSARPLAVVCTLIQAVAMAYSPSLSNREPEKFKISGLRALVPFLNVSEDVAFFVIAFAVHTGSVPMSHAVLRWVAEFAGRYPLVSFHKHAAEDYARRRGGKAKGEEGTSPSREDRRARGRRRGRGKNDADEESCPDTPRDEPSSSSTTTTVAAEEKRTVATLEQTIAALTGLPLEGPKLPLNGEGGGGGGGGGKSSSGGLNSAHTASIKAARKKALSAREEQVQDHREATGPTVTMPLENREQLKRQMAETAHDMLEGKRSPVSVGYRYKKEEVASPIDGKPDIYYNPNYLIVDGTEEMFADKFVATTNTKLMKSDVRVLLAGLRRKHIPAHLLPHIPIAQTDLLLDLETHRVALWHSRVAKRVDRVPAVIADRGRWYILIEALLASPKHIVRRTLESLCNETTVERSVVLPMPDKRFPELLHTFEAHPVPGKVLRCNNPSYAGPSEIATLPPELQDVIRRNSRDGECPKNIVWSHERELESIRDFFRDNGVVSSPNGFTEAALHDFYVTSRFEDKPADEGPIYPQDQRGEMEVFDQEAKDIVLGRKKKKRCRKNVDDDDGTVTIGHPSKKKRVTVDGVIDVRGQKKKEKKSPTGTRLGEFGHDEDDGDRSPLQSDYDSDLNSPSDSDGKASLWTKHMDADKVSEIVTDKVIVQDIE